MNADSPLLGIYVSTLQQSNLRGTQPVPIRHQKNRLIPLRPNDLEQTAQLILCKEVNSALLRTSHVRRGERLHHGR
jgi:hypothetical protein